MHCIASNIASIASNPARRPSLSRHQENTGSPCDGGSCMTELAVALGTIFVSQVCRPPKRNEPCP